MWNSREKLLFLHAVRFTKLLLIYIHTQKPSNLISLDELSPKIRWQKIFRTQMNFSWFEREQKITLPAKKRFNQTTEKCTFSFIPSAKLMAKLNGYETVTKHIWKKGTTHKSNRDESDPKKSNVCNSHSARLELNRITLHYWMTTE